MRLIGATVKVTKQLVGVTGKVGTKTSGSWADRCPTYRHVARTTSRTIASSSGETLRSWSEASTAEARNVNPLAVTASALVIARANAHHGETSRAAATHSVMDTETAVSCAESC
jgi:hypothetical protein